MLLLHLARVATLLFSSQAVTASVVARATTCNGHAELCSRSYGNVTIVGAHDSYAVGASDLASNQDYDVTKQLTDGIRLLQVQALQQSDGIHLCHTSCLLKDAGLAVNYFKKVKSWLDANKNDVVTILIVNVNNVPSTQWQSLYKSAGLDALSYSPTKATLKASEWPTLGDMIDSGKRLVTFIDNQADFNTVPFLIDEFSNVWETAFDVTEASFPCTINRTNAEDTSTQLYLINHFLDKVSTIGGISAPSPFKAQLTVTNAASGPGSLGAEVTTCITAQGRPPTFMLVDFYEYGGGSVFQVAATVNGVQYTPPPSLATPILNATAGTTSVPLNNKAAAPFVPETLLRGVGAIVFSILFGAWAAL